MSLGRNNFYQLQECFKDIWCICKFQRRSFSCDGLTVSFLYSAIQIPIHTSYNMGLFEQIWHFKSFLHAQAFDLCSSSKRYVCITHIFLLEDEKCLLKKLYLRSENDPAKEMHTITHKKENMKDKKEREKYEMLEYAILQALKG